MGVIFENGYGRRSSSTYLEPTPLLSLFTILFRFKGRTKAETFTSGVSMSDWNINIKIIRVLIRINNYSIM